MANSLLKIPAGPIWPLGCILVATPGTPVNIMSLVDPNNYNAPETIANFAGQGAEYSPRFNQATFQGYKSGGATRLANNTGNIYLVMKPLASAGGITDVGNIIEVIQTAQTFTLVSSALNRNDYGPYQLYIDADNAGDGCLVSLFIA